MYISAGCIYFQFKLESQVSLEVELVFLEPITSLKIEQHGAHVYQEHLTTHLQDNVLVLQVVCC